MASDQMGLKRSPSKLIPWRSMEDKSSTLRCTRRHGRCIMVLDYDTGKKVRELTWWLIRHVLRAGAQGIYGQAAGRIFSVIQQNDRTNLRGTNYPLMQLALPHGIFYGTRLYGGVPAGGWNPRKFGINAVPGIECKTGRSLAGAKASARLTITAGPPMG